MSGLPESEELPVCYIPKIYMSSSHRKAVCCVAFNEDRTLLASGGTDNLLLIWSCRTGVLLHNIETKATVLSLIWTSSNALLGGLQDGLLVLVRITEVCIGFLNHFLVLNELRR
jgi:WD40 repeat protein